jgi:hypothetical protein
LQVFVGPGTPFEIAEGPRVVEDFPDGSHETILVIEAAEPVPWTKPADLDYSPDRPLPSLGTPDGPHWPYWFERRTYVFALADGSVQWRRRGRLGRANGVCDTSLSATMASAGVMIGERPCLAPSGSVK